MPEKLKKAVEEGVGETFELRKCRHTFRQRALDEGHDIHNVWLVMGHSTISTTQIYLHISDQNARRVLMDKHPRGRISTERYLSKPWE